VARIDEYDALRMPQRPLPTDEATFGAPRRGRVAALCIALVLVTLAAYSTALRGEFIWDDDDYIRDNALLRAPDGLGVIWTPYWLLDDAIIGADVHTKQYYPLVFTTFYLEYTLWGLDPLGYHLVNVLLHAGTSLLLWRLLASLRVPGACFIAFVFALHPVHVESVAWMTERKNVLSGFLAVSAALAYLRFDRSRWTGSDAPARGESPWAWYALSLGLFTLALLAKTIVACMPAAIVLIHLWRRDRLTVARLWPLVPFFLVAVPLALHTAWYEANVVGASGIEFERCAAERLIVACRALLFYPVKLLWPQPLIFIYPRWEVNASSALEWWPVAVVAAIFGGLLWLWWKRGVRGPFLAWSFYAGAVFPALGFADVYPHRYSFVADHFNYLPSIGIIAIVAAGLIAVWRGVRESGRVGPAAAARVPIAFAVVILAALGAKTFAQGRIYANVNTLYHSILGANPGAWMAAHNLGLTRLMEAREIGAGDAAARRAALEQALELLDQAIAHKPTHHAAHFNRAITLFELNRLDEALGSAKRAIDEWNRVETRPIRVKYVLNVGAISAAMGEFEAARDWYERTLAEVERQTPGALRGGTYFTALAGFADVSRRLRDYGEARRRYVQAWEAAATPDEQATAGFRAAWFLATCPDAGARDPRRALAIAADVVAISRRAPDALDALATAHAAAGEFDEAVAVADQALAAARARGDDLLGRAIESRRALYLERRPYIGSEN
jgi:tetratricopeptide (TPR) repeat protein